MSGLPSLPSLLLNSFVPILDLSWPPRFRFLILGAEKRSGDDGVRGSHVEELFCCRGDRVANVDIGLEVLTPGAGELVVVLFP